jgi:hypothetical protein
MESAKQLGTGLLRLMLNNFSQSTQRVIHGFRIWEHLRHVGIENDRVATFRESIYIFPTNAAAKVILVQHLRVRLIIQFLIHILIV